MSFNFSDFEWADGRFIGDIRTIDECKEAMTALSARIAVIQGQITDAKILAASEGRYADRVWWRKVNTSLSINKAARQHLQDLAGKIRRAESDKKGTSNDEKLIKALRAYVGEEVFLKIAAQIE